MLPQELTSILRTTESRIASPAHGFSKLLTDSRQLTDPEEVLFFAIRTHRNDGVRYVEGLYGKGVRNFVVSSDTDEETRQRLEAHAEANLWFVADVVSALQYVNRMRLGSLSNTATS